MDLYSIINRVSVLYRSEVQKKSDIVRRVVEIDKEFEEAQKNDWTTMPYSRWLELNQERMTLERDRRYYDYRAEGMFDVREMLLDLLDQEMLNEEKNDEQKD